MPAPPALDSQPAAGSGCSWLSAAARCHQHPTPWHSGEARAVRGHCGGRRHGLRACPGVFALPGGLHRGTPRRGWSRPFPQRPSPYGSASLLGDPLLRLLNPACLSASGPAASPRRPQSPPPAPYKPSAAHGAQPRRDPPDRSLRDAARCRRRTGSAAERPAVAAGRRRWVTASSGVPLARADGAGGGARSLWQRGAAPRRRLWCGVAAGAWRRCVAGSGSAPAPLQHRGGGALGWARAGFFLSGGLSCVSTAEWVLASSGEPGGRRLQAAADPQEQRVTCGNSSPTPSL